MFLKNVIGLSILVSSAVSFAQSKYFLVQNIATEKARVYERCTEYKGCPHKMIFQTDILVGRIKKDDLNTRAGSFKIDKWVKFYQDHAKLYPSWYDPSYPSVPKPGSGPLAWYKKKHLPNGKGEGRGAFGWYAATLYPNANAQWLHGTTGWGPDSTDYIKRAKSPILNFFSELRSHGCTRFDNPSIAYLQSLLPVGTEVYRVYALEELEDESLSRYADQKSPGRFDYILTRTEVRSSKPTSIRTDKVQSQLSSGAISESDILEKGSYPLNRYPEAYSLRKKSASSGKSGDTYKIKEQNFRGYFNVDTGLFINYSHPSQIQVGGIKGAAAFPSDIFLNK